VSSARSASGTPAAAGSQPQRGTPTEPQSPAGTTGETEQTQPGGDGSAIQNPEAKRYADEAAQWRTTARKAEADLKKFQDAQLTAEEKRERDFEAAQKAATDAQRELQELKLSRAIERQAATLKIISPEIAAKLLDWADIDYDDNGAPKNLEKLLSALVTTYPHLAQPDATQASAHTAGGATNPGRSAQISPTGAPVFRVSQLADFEFAMAHKAEIEQATREGRIVQD
jgi:Phage minor structural protein GP20